MKVAPIEIDWNPNLSIYASEKFLRSVGDKYGWLGGTDDSGNIRCILPYTIVRKATIQMVRFRVETILLDPDFGVEEERAFLDSAMEYFQSIRADIIIPATTNTIFRTYPNGAVVAPYGTLIIDLDQPEETLWGNVHSKHRNVIRNAAKKGVQIHSGTEHSQTAYKLIMKMIVGLGPSVKVFIADYQGEVQGSAVLPFSNYSAYYVYGGSVPEPLTGAMNLLQWEAIRHFRNLGVKHYDFCGVRIDPDKGSKQAGLKMFKERFGPRFVKGYMWKYSLNPLKSSIYSLAVRLFRGGDIVDAERHKLNSPGTGNT
jgi:hypothetical protein